MGFGTELLLAVALGFLILGPKRMHSLLVQLGRAKNEFQKMSAGIKKELSANLDSDSLKIQASPSLASADVTISESPATAHLPSS